MNTLCIPPCGGKLKINGGSHLVFWSAPPIFFWIRIGLLSFRGMHDRVQQVLIVRIRVSIALTRPPWYVPKREIIVAR